MRTQENKKQAIHVSEKAPLRLCQTTADGPASLLERLVAAALTKFELSQWGLMVYEILQGWFKTFFGS